MLMEQLDPLYVIFEQHLFNFQDPDVDRKTFIGNVIKEYISHLRKLNISIPKSLSSLKSSPGLQSERPANPG
jgi:hypothetical protein